MRRGHYPVILPPISKVDLTRFWKFVGKRGPDECWPWKGCTDGNYGLFRLGGKQMRATRIMFRIKTGRDPYPLMVLHTCDNPPCCNPKHLWEGTTRDNSLDSSRKGRNRISEEVKNKISRALNGKPLSEEHKVKLRANIAVAHAASMKIITGRPLSEEHKQKIRQVWLERGGGPMKGKHHSLESRVKISRGLQGREYLKQPKSPETKAKLSKALKEYFQTKAGKKTRKEISSSLKTYYEKPAARRRNALAQILSNQQRKAAVTRKCLPPATSK